ncbi:hypothetical protein RIVM261_019530 [Rivularia sp. IAM M-261]|nr:hypothetical protein CAL7716_027780 [Calothrix sp. PCC 7716]GJD16997.1 hypothetical protein RIVM261_019530 [Rivularia sp. IAM M-261]
MIGGKKNNPRTKLTVLVDILNHAACLIEKLSRSILLINQASQLKANISEAGNVIIDRIPLVIGRY